MTIAISQKIMELPTLEEDDEDIEFLENDDIVESILHPVSDNKCPLKKI